MELIMNYNYEYLFVYTLIYVELLGKVYLFYI